MVRKALVTLLLARATMPALTYARSGYIDCADAPKVAVLTMPAAAERFARVTCTKWGHAIQAAEGYTWSKQGVFYPVLFPAQMERRDQKTSGHADYFKEIRARELTGDEAEKKWQVIAPLFRGRPTPPKIKAVEIVAINQSEQPHTIYLFNIGWAYGCSPDCSKDAAFVVYNKERKPAIW